MAVIMTTIWSSSFIFIKIGLKEIPALPFASLRYIMAFIFCSLFVTRSARGYP